MESCFVHRQRIASFPQRSPRMPPQACFFRYRCHRTGTTGPLCHRLPGRVGASKVYAEFLREIDFRRPVMRSSLRAKFSRVSGAPLSKGVRTPRSAFRRQALFEAATIESALTPCSYDVPFAGRSIRLAARPRLSEIFRGNRNAESRRMNPAPGYPLQRSMVVCSARWRLDGEKDFPFQTMKFPFGVIFTP
jgi:hypothetical protein